MNTIPQKCHSIAARKPEETCVEKTVTLCSVLNVGEKPTCQLYSKKNYDFFFHFERLRPYHP